MLNIRPAPLPGGHVFQDIPVFALIADKMRWLDVVLSMCPMMIQRNHMIEGETSRASLDSRVNVPFADVAPVPVTSKDMLVVHFSNSGILPACGTLPATFCTSQSGLWLLAFLTIIGSGLFYIRFIASTVTQTFRWQQMPSIFMPMDASLSQATSITARIIAIPLCFIFPKFTKQFFRLTSIAPLVARCNGNTTPIATFARILSALIFTVNTIFARGSIASCRERVNIKGIDGLFIPTLFAYLRYQEFAFWGILDVLPSLQSTPLIPTVFTPRLISASACRAFIKLVKGLFDRAIGTHPRRKQKELDRMIYFTHGNGLHIGYCLDSGDASNIPAIEQIFPIISQISLRNNFTAFPAEIGGALCR